MSLFDPAAWPDQRGTATLYRSPAASGGTVGALAAVGTVIGVFVPVQAWAAGGWGPAPDGLGGARYDTALIVAGTAVRVGDSVRRGSTIYMVQRVDVWTPTASVAWLELPG